MEKAQEMLEGYEGDNLENGFSTLTHHIAHKLSMLSTYVGPTSRCDATWRCLRGINLPG